MSKFIFSLLFILTTFSLAAQDRKEDTGLVEKMPSGHFLRFSFVFAELRLNAFFSYMPVFQQCLAEKQLATIAYLFRLFSLRSVFSAKKSCT
jgi:hypothetical protein